MITSIDDKCVPGSTALTSFGLAASAAGSFLGAN